MTASSQDELVAVQRADAELVDETAQFFAPVTTDLFTELLGQYQEMRARVEAVAEMVTGSNAVAVSYFLEGNKDRDRGAPSVEKLFEIKGGIASLNSAYWSKTLALTDVFEMMPQARRDEWNKSIREMTTPDYTEEAVRPTITELLNMRAKFLAERVDGIFRSLSGEHVTNAPEAFGKRMIFAGLRGYSSYSMRGVLNDLRCVVAKFMGRDEPKYNMTDRLVDALERNFGQWVSIDGGALRIRLYMKGTAHLEVHPDMAWRLNSILANLYPLAIPAQFRQKPKKQAKTFTMMGRPLPFAVLEILGSMSVVREFKGERRFDSKAATVPNARQFGYGSHGKAAEAEATRILESIGGAQVSTGVFHFDYEPGAVLSEIVASGCIPDQKSYQFYPTPESLARRVFELADIGPFDAVLEPSAGQGGLADLFPKDRTTCVEISALNCKVLTAKGHKVVQADFMEWQTTAAKFDCVVMNPPFSESRWKDHTTAASSLVIPGGTLVAILPASAKNKEFLPGMTHEWHGPFENEFAGTSVSVVILKAVRA